MALAEECAAKNKSFCSSSLPHSFRGLAFKDKTAPFYYFVVSNETETLAYTESHDQGDC